jgi:hypothetical protein
MIGKHYARIGIMTFRFHVLRNRCNNDLNFKEITPNQSFSNFQLLSSLRRFHPLSIVKSANNYQPGGENCPIRNILGNFSLNCCIIADIELQKRVCRSHQKQKSPLSP